jgi:predicted transcriptional regulator
MERYALIDIADMATVLEGAESVIVITEKEGEVILNYSHDLNQMEVLDLLALVTSQFYEIADEGDTPLH